MRHKHEKPCKARKKEAREEVNGQTLIGSQPWQRIPVNFSNCVTVLV